MHDNLKGDIARSSRSIPGSLPLVQALCSAVYASILVWCLLHPWLPNWQGVLWDDNSIMSWGRAG